MSHESNIEEGEISEPNGSTQYSSKPLAPQHHERGYNERGYQYHGLPPPPPPRYSSYSQSRPRDNYSKYSVPLMRAPSDPLLSSMHPQDFPRPPPPPPPPPSQPRPSSRQSDHHEADMDIDHISTAPPPVPVVPPLPPAPVVEPPPPLITIVTDPSQQVQDFYAAPLPPPHSKPNPIPTTSAAAPRPLLLPKPILMPTAPPALTSQHSSSTVSGSSPSTPFSTSGTPTTPSDAEDRRRRLKWGQGLKRQVSASKVDEMSVAPVTEEAAVQQEKKEDAAAGIVATAPIPEPEKDEKDPVREEPSVPSSPPQPETPLPEPDEEEGSDNNAAFNAPEEEVADEGVEDDDLVDSDDEEPAVEKGESSDEEDDNDAGGEDEEQEEEESDLKVPAKNKQDASTDGGEADETADQHNVDESPPGTHRRSVGRPALTERAKQQRKLERKERKMSLAEEDAAAGRPGRGRASSEDKRRRAKNDGDDGTGDAPRRKRGRPSAAAIAAGQSGKKSSRSSPSTSGGRQRERHPLTKVFTTIPDLKRAVTALQYMIHIQTQLKGPDKQPKFLEYMRNPNLIVNLPLPLVSEISGCLDYIESRGQKCYETLHLLHMEQYKRLIGTAPEPPSPSLMTTICQTSRHKLHEAHIFTKTMPPVLIHDANTSTSHNIYDSNKLREQLVAKRPIMAQIIRNKVMHKKTAWVNSTNMYLSKYDKWKHHESSSAYNDSSFDKYDYDCLRSSRFRNDEAQILHKLAIGHMMEKRLKFGCSDVVNMISPWVFPDRNMNLANTNTEAFSSQEYYYPLHIAEPCAIISVHTNRLTTDGKRQQCINTTGVCTNCNCALAVDAEEKRSNLWSDMEKCIFVDKFIQYPKNFSKIASYLTNKSTKDVIQFYYDTKYKMNYKVLLKEVDNRKRGLKNTYDASSNAARVCGGVLHATSTKYFYQVPIDENTYNAPLPHPSDQEAEEQDVSKLSNELQLLLRRHVEDGGKETPITHHHHSTRGGRGRGGRRGRRGNRNRGDAPPLRAEEPEVAPPDASSMMRPMTGRGPVGGSRGRRGRGRGRRGRGNDHEGTARQISRRRLATERSSSSEAENENFAAEKEVESEDSADITDTENAKPELTSECAREEINTTINVPDVDAEVARTGDAATDDQTDENMRVIAHDVVHRLIELCASAASMLTADDKKSEGNLPVTGFENAPKEESHETTPLATESENKSCTEHSGEVNGGEACMTVSMSLEIIPETDVDRKRKLSEESSVAAKCMRTDALTTGALDKPEVQDKISAKTGSVI